MLSTFHLSQVLRSGFADPGTLLHLFVGGSELHGAKVGATDDLDLYGVFLDLPEVTLGLAPRTHFVWSSAPDERRNGPEDVDLTLYSLHRWAQLAAKGNATALHFVFAQATATSDPIWLQLEKRRQLFLSSASAEQFLGFAGNQRRRIVGEKDQGEHGRRPEYESRYGYDAKAAMHCLRLYFECIELMREGKITLPRPERELLIEVRLGVWPLARIQAEVERLRLEAESAAQVSTLPETVDFEAISRLVAELSLALLATRYRNPGGVIAGPFL